MKCPSLWDVTGLRFSLVPTARRFNMLTPGGCLTDPTSLLISNLT
jgi:hypothetical protein